MIITIDGVVAVGKSTTCLRLEKRLFDKGVRCQYLPESYDRKLLPLYIENPKKYIKIWTKDITKRKIAVYRAAQTYDMVSIIDRSYIGDLAISLMRLNNGEMSQELYNWQVEKFKCLEDINIDLRVMLVCPPEEAMFRCTSRSMNGESLYNIEYFRSQSECHDKLISPDKDKWVVINVPRDHSMYV